jgi:hypothetical protein
MLEIDASETTKPATCPQAESEADVNYVPPSIIQATSTILRFYQRLSDMSCRNQSDDEIAALNLEVLSNLAAPPLVHRLWGTF